MILALVHHADAVGPDVDTRRPLSAQGRAQADAVAAALKARGVVPAAVWHSGKLRARETAEAVWRACNPFATFTMVRGLLPDDPPSMIAIAIQRESRDLAVVGHMPNVAAVARLLAGVEDFPLHGSVVLESRDEGVTWSRAAPRLAPKV